MRITTSLLIVLASFLFSTSCKQNTTSTNSHTADTTAVEATKAVNEPETTDDLYVAGHVFEHDANSISLRGPKGIEWVIMKADIKDEQVWTEPYKDIKGEPKILHLVKGAKIKYGNEVLEVGPNFNNKGDAARCSCAVRCSNGGDCCPVGGWIQRCSGCCSCYVTQERC